MVNSWSQDLTEDVFVDPVGSELSLLPIILPNIRVKREPLITAILQHLGQKRKIKSEEHNEFEGEV